MSILEHAATATNKNSLYVDLIKTISNTTPAKCIQNGTQVSILKKNNPEKLDTVLLEAINFVNLTVNVGKKMDTFQAIDAVVTIQAEYWQIKVEEIVKALNNGRTGKYGEIYRLDLATLCGWIDKYINSEREDALEEIRVFERENLEKKNAEGRDKELVSEEKLKEYNEQFLKLMAQVQDKKQMDKPAPLDEKVWKDSIQNNLPLLTDEALREWKKTFKESEMLDLLEMANIEIEYRSNKKKYKEEK